MHNKMGPLKQINKTTFLIVYEQLHVNSHHNHKKTDSLAKQRGIQPDVPIGLRQTGHATPYQATVPSPTPPNPINQSTCNFQPANS
jgi:hypothetical protein